VTTASGDVVIEAPIVAVTVFPDRARVTRAGLARLVAGEHRVVIEDLPLSLQADSVRVAGSAAPAGGAAGAGSAGAGAVTVLGVDVNRRHHAETPDEVTRALEERLREARARLAALEDDDAVAAERLAFLGGLARRATRSYANALAAGQADPGAVAALADALAAQQAEVRRERRDLIDRRERLHEEIAAYDRELNLRRRQQVPDRLAVWTALAVEGDEETEIALELSYLVYGAGWRSAYDLRLDRDTLAVSWFGVVSQSTGEDWPECDLRLSTARPSGSLIVPELDPWFLDRYRPQPVPPPAPAMAMADAMVPYGGAVGEEAMPKARGITFAAQPAPMRDTVAVLEQGATAATYQPTRPVAVPADGGSHRATVAITEMTARRDYVTAPVLAAEAHLRATVVNTSPHTLPAGTAAVFHAGDFVGSTALPVWAPGEEVELALGVDDRVRVERELVRRTAAKAVLGSTRRREAEFTVTVTNHTPDPARVTVLDQLPVSRDEAIVVKELRLDPAPAERTDMGVLTWVLELGPGEVEKIHFGVRVEVARGVEMIGWRE
jgi:uncharacterized protein (TIGR02231 family)